MKMKRFIAILAAAAALLTSSCEILLGPDEPAGTGALSIVFGSNSGGSRAAVPAYEELADLHYDLVLTGPGNQKKEVSVSAGEGYTGQVVLGTWRIDAEARYPDDVLFGRGSAAVTVKAGIKNHAWVHMEVVPPEDTPAPGTGSFNTPAQYREMVLATPDDSAPVNITGSDAYRYASNSPPINSGVFIQNRTVILSPFKIAKYETTYELWYEVKRWGLNAARGANKYAFPYNGLEGREGKDGTSGAAPTAAKLEPVTDITWRDAIVWCNAYSEMSGKEPVYYTDATYSTVLRVSLHDPTGSDKATDKAVMKPGADGYRLPTEAEWEYAARGGKTPSTSGSFVYKYAGTSTQSELKNYAWYGESAADGNTHPVGRKQPNALGLHDMTGNVHEWCWDWYDSPVSTGTVTNPTGAAPKTHRVHRGGCYFNTGDSLCAVATRHEKLPYNGGGEVGFRVVCR